MFRVLIAETEPLVREALRVILIRSGVFGTIVCAADAGEALEFCHREIPDLVFVSLSLPGCSGLELARRIHTSFPEASLALITEDDTVRLAREALDLKVVGYLAKPLSLAAASEIVQRHKTLHSFCPLWVVEAFSAALGAKNFATAYGAIPQAARDILSQAGRDPLRRHEIFCGLGRKLLALLGASEALSETGPPLPVFEPDRLTVANGAALCLFQMLDHAFRRNCLRAYPVLEEAFVFIDKNVTERIGLDDVVGVCAASQTHVSRIFKKYFALSVMDYLHLRKIHLAKMFFVYGKKSASDAAFALGYTEAGYFSKVFKKFEGMTVQQYKSLHLEQGA